jgi:hypothetical protein
MSPTQRGVVLDHVVLDYMALDPMVLVRDACDRIVLERVVLDGLSCVIAGAVLPRTFADLFWPCNVGDCPGDSLGERARGRGGGRTTFCCLMLRLVAGPSDLFGLDQLHLGGISVVSRWYLGGVPVAGCSKKAKSRKPLKPQLRRISFSSFFEF